MTVKSSPPLVPLPPGWVWWPGPHGHPRAQGPGMPVVRGHNYTVLTARIRKGRVPMDGQIAELEHLFKDEGWVFGTMWLSANSGPDGRSLTARRGGVLLAALTVDALAEKIRHEEGQ